MRTKRKNPDMDQIKVPFFKRKKVKYGAISTGIIALFIVAMVLVNILATALSDNLIEMSLDLTASKDYTIGEQNREWIEAIDKPVNIVFTCTEDYYKNDYYQSISEQYSDLTGGQYFVQTVELLKNYTKLNSNITLKFIDSNTPDFYEYYEKYSSEDFYAGDIIIESSFENSAGELQERYKVLSLDDLYLIDDTYAQTYGYLISGSNVESKVTSALYYVTKEQQDKVTFITGYGCYNSAALSDFTTMLTENNYDVTEIGTLDSEEIPADTDILVLAAPQTDMSENEIKILNDFLMNADENGDPQFSKNLLFFASSKQTSRSLPNIEGLLSDWGITFADGIVYETDSSYHVAGSNTLLAMFSTETDYMASLNTGFRYYSDDLRPMTAAFSEQGNYKAQTIIATNTTAVIRPYDADASWNPDDAERMSYAGMIYSNYSENNGETTSNILAVASDNFIGTGYNTSSYGNFDLMQRMMDTMVGRQADENYEVETKVIDTATFAAPSETTVNVMTVIVYVIPVLVVVFGVIVYIRRRVK